MSIEIHKASTPGITTTGNEYVDMSRTPEQRRKRLIEWFTGPPQATGAGQQLCRHCGINPLIEAHRCFLRHLRRGVKP